MTLNGTVSSVGREARLLLAQRPAAVGEFFRSSDKAAKSRLSSGFDRHLFHVNTPGAMSRR